MNDVMLFDIIQCICEDKIWESKYKLEMITQLLFEKEEKTLPKPQPRPQNTKEADGST